MHFKTQLNGERTKPRYVFPVGAVLWRIFLLVFLISMAVLYFRWEKIRPLIGHQENMADSREESGGENMPEDGSSGGQFQKLVGNVQEIWDWTGSHSFKIPENWEIKSREGEASGLLSRTVVASQSFVEIQDGKYWRYTDGARLTVSMTEGEEEAAKAEDGGHGEALRWKGSVRVDGREYEYHVIRDLGMREGRLVDFHLAKGGRTYYFRFVYNPKKYEEGEIYFREIVSTFRIWKE